MKIGGLVKTSLIDYPGKVCAVIFTQGCNFRCPYCHNPELVYPDRFRETLPPEEVLAFLEKRRGRLEGVVVSGGEPTLQEDLPAFLRLLKSLGYSVKLDTNGSRPDVLRRLAAGQTVDYIAMDIKAPLDKYGLVSGVSLDPGGISESIKIIKDSGIRHEFRTTFDKELLAPRDIEAIRLLAGRSPYSFHDRLPVKEKT